jgi:hypothetical protein
MSRAALEDYYTLLAVRADGVAPVVDLFEDAPMEAVAARARAMLAEHASCSSVEVWRDGCLLERFDRG